MLENGIVRYVLIAGAFVFGSCQLVAMPLGKMQAERAVSAQVVSMAATSTAR